MKHRSQFFAAVLVFAFAALLMAGGASAATVRISVTGSVTTSPVDPATIDLAAASDLGGANATGTITLTSPTVFAGATTNVFHGDIAAGGCVRVEGNQAIIVGKLPANEVFTFTGPPPFGPITHVAALIEDNGVGTPVDRAAAIWLKSTSATNFCTSKPFSDVGSTVIGLDAGDASILYTDLLNANPPLDGPDSDVSVVDPNGLSVTITDAADPDGLRVVTGPGIGPATIHSCGDDVNVVQNSEVLATCGSLILQVVTGSAEVILEDGLSSVSIPAGGKAEIGDDGSGGHTVANLGTTPITVTVDGVEATVDPGETSTVEAWDFQGFFWPIDNPPKVNKWLAGLPVPLSWRVLDASGAPVTDLSSAAITVSNINCTTGADLGQLGPGASIGGLNNLKKGYYNLNWKTQKTYAGTCKAMHLDIGDGVTHDAYFKFTK